MTLLTKRFARMSPAARREALTFYVCILPWLLGFIIFVAYPMFRSLYLSFTNYQIGRTPIWIGMANFERLVRDGNFWQSLKVTALYTLGSVPGSTILAIGIAMLLAQKVRFVSVWRTIYFLPSVVSAVAVAVLWSYVFNPEYGLINSLLALVGIKGPGWVTSEDWALPSLIIMSWWVIGGQIVIYLAGLKNIPNEFYEVADIDGAGPWTKFWRITVPMLSPTIFFNLVIGFIGALQVFEGPWILSGGRGGPNRATLTYMMNLYKQGFELGSLGYASALAWVLFVIIIILTALIIRSSSFWVYYEAKR
nr:MAG: ABC transporter permease [Chloroflexota bacterium]